MSNKSVISSSGRLVLIVVPLLVSLMVGGCASVQGSAPEGAGYNVRLPIIPLDAPRPIKTIEVYDAKTKRRVEADVLSLKSSEIRGRLTTYESLTTVQKRDSSGGLTYLGSGAKVAKGTYIVTFDYVNSTVQDVEFNDGVDRRATGKIGVGLRITAEITTLSNDVDITGLLPIGLAFRDNKVSGSLRFNAFGLSNDKVASLVPATMQNVDFMGIQKAFEAAATVRLLIGLDETKLEPNLIGVSGVRVDDAKKALDAAKMKFVGPI
ncbi:hypothetical protein HX866_30435 [Pseudomonas gingeri]|uniref:hypothetical protein n=1 Tax=Pseudomonas gingeri TaxID=117681 RepID=UPI0015A24B4D|nr:hypothetical protein [Pseudomonas gingeri]NWA29212.1 hypothetical protein [Pseudomonas gingeri]